MKLKAPNGVGEPCVAGVAVACENGCYEVEAEIGALLIEAFGFVEVAAAPQPVGVPASRRARRGGAAPNRSAARKNPIED